MQTVATSEVVCSQVNGMLFRNEGREMTDTILLFGGGASAEQQPCWVQAGHGALHRAGDEREVLFPRGALNFIEYGDS